MVQMVENGPNGRKWSKWSKMVKNGGPDLKQAQRTGLSARRAQRTKSRGPKGPQLEVGARRVPRLLVFLYLSVDFWKLQWSGRLWRCKLQQCLEYWALDICMSILYLHLYLHLHLYLSIFYICLSTSRDCSGVVGSGDASYSNALTTKC